MAKEYHPLRNNRLNPNTGYRRPPQRLPDIVSPNSPALHVMTDLSKVAAYTIGPCATLDEANQRMIGGGVRMLLVTDQENHIQGIIAARDILGEKPMAYLQQVGGKRGDIFVRDIMIPQEQIDVLHLSDVSKSRVGDIVETLKQTGRQHALVVEQNENDEQVVRGLFSARQISRQLGELVETTEVANTFAELKAMLGR